MVSPACAGTAFTSGGFAGDGDAGTSPDVGTFRGRVCASLVKAKLDVKATRSVMYLRKLIHLLSQLFGKANQARVLSDAFHRVLAEGDDNLVKFGVGRPENYLFALPFPDLQRVLIIPHLSDDDMIV